MLTRIYYFLKPIIPWRLRVALRKWRAQRRRRAYAAVWPIDPAAAAVPPGWPGWPDGKQFALVLTHDVEGPKGLGRIPQLVELTQKYGFRSSFNLVAQGPYQVERPLLDFIDHAGFEVGVHGLGHDGKLYRSQKEFASKALKIRTYLKEWNSVGFRSPLMQHRLGWLHELRSEYDLSTFDVDPFEPQSDGMATIFPFWVSGRGGFGFVELPYSLVQDFSLFKVLEEKNIDIWKKKLDWVAEHGGMALINSHPDYMCFNGHASPDEYPVAHYEEFLRYVKEKYSGSFWQALPKEVSRYYCQKLPPGSRNTRRKVCMLAYTEYESDDRVRHYAESLASRGDMVEVLALTGQHTRQPKSEINGVTVYSVSDPRGFLSRLRFFTSALLAITKLHARNRYDVVHVFGAPALLAVAAWYPRVTGARLILDMEETVSEPAARPSPGFIHFVHYILRSGRQFGAGKEREYLDLIDDLATGTFSS